MYFDLSCRHKSNRSPNCGLLHFLNFKQFSQYYFAVNFCGILFQSTGSLISGTINYWSLFVLHIQCWVIYSNRLFALALNRITLVIPNNYNQTYCAHACMPLAQQAIDYTSSFKSLSHAQNRNLKKNNQTNNYSFSMQNVYYLPISVDEPQIIKIFVMRVHPLSFINGCKMHRTHCPCRKLCGKSAPVIQHTCMYTRHLVSCICLLMLTLRRIQNYKCMMLYLHCAIQFSGCPACPLTITLSLYTVAQNKMSHRTKCNFSITDRDFLTKISGLKCERFFNLENLDQFK